jgi:hypothetical protein
MRGYSIAPTFAHFPPGWLTLVSSLLCLPTETHIAGLHELHPSSFQLNLLYALPTLGNHHHHAVVQHILAFFLSIQQYMFDGDKGK